MGKHKLTSVKPGLITNPKPAFKIGAGVRVKNSECIGTVLNCDDLNRIIVLYFDKAGVAHDLFLPVASLVTVDSDGK